MINQPILIHLTALYESLLLDVTNIQTAGPQCILNELVLCPQYMSDDISYIPITCPHLLSPQ